MVRKYAAVFAARGEEIRVPAECLVEMGLAEGERMVVEALPGRLFLTPFWDAQAVRGDLREIARDLEAIRSRLRRVAGVLPDLSGSAEEEEPFPGFPAAGAAAGAAGPPVASGAAAAAADLLGTLECILADDIEPALAKLLEAVALASGQAGEV